MNGVGKGQSCRGEVGLLLPLLFAEIPLLKTETFQEILTKFLIITDWNNGTEWVLRAGDKYMDIEWTKETRKEHWIKMALKQIPNFSGLEEFDVDFCYTDKCNGAMHTVAASMLVVALPLLNAIRMFQGARDKLLPDLQYNLNYM